MLTTPMNVLGSTQETFDPMFDRTTFGTERDCCPDSLSLNTLIGQTGFE